MFRFRLTLAAAAMAALAQTPPPPPISPDALRVEVSFLASDQLKGRETPSPELDAAGGFIASQFARAGLEPAGSEGFFQTALLREVTPVADGFHMSLGGTEVPAGRVGLLLPGFLDMQNVPIDRVAKADMARLGELNSAEGRVLVVEENPQARGREILKQIARLKPVALLLLSPFPNQGVRNVPQLLAADEDLPTCPVLLVSDPDGKLSKGLPENATATIRMSAPKARAATARNVAGLLRGTDPQLRDTYVVVSAHYDHLGRGRSGTGDAIFSGANDNASGAASLIEIAAAVAARRPKRSVLFVAWFGEEMGMLGSRYYVRHPLVPLGRTVAEINLEQMGRTDDNDGPRVGRANITGFDYSNIGAIFAEAGKPLGVDFSPVEGKSDRYFRASDNFPFAQAGIPSHTVSVTYVFPDYHAVGDQWQKLDYENMARVDRAVAAGVLAIAENPDPPKWSGGNPKAEPFRNVISSRP